MGKLPRFLPLVQLLLTNLAVPGESLEAPLVGSGPGPYASVGVLVEASGSLVAALAENSAVIDGAGDSNGIRKFRCLGGGDELPASVVNDDFCDCLDGTDEPGTGACAGWEDSLDEAERLFYCENLGSRPRYIYRSRVGDGICDCCDGTDEVDRAASSPVAVSPCSNTCEEEGRGARQALEQRLQLWRRGLVKQVELMAASDSGKTLWKDEASELRAALLLLEAERDASKKALEDASVKLAEVSAPMVASVDEQKDDLRRQLRDVEQLIATKQQERDRLLAKLAQLDVTVTATRKQDDALPGDSSVALEVSPSVSGSVSETPRVSEYSKWMEGAADRGLASAPVVSAASSEPLVPSSVPVADSVQLVPEMEAPELRQHRECEARFVDARTRAMEAKHRLRGLEAVMHEGLTGPSMALANLLDVCLEYKSGPLAYSICFFRNATQDTDSEKAVSLGRWIGWDFAQVPPRALFARGASCGTGVRRKLSVIFGCGHEVQLLNVSEPLSCVYQAGVSHPAACSDVAEPTSQVLSPHRPRDEL